MKVKNIYSLIPPVLPLEITETLLESKNLRVERIVSKGHKSPSNGWYDQAENELVFVLKGSAKLQYPTGEEFVLQAGDYLDIPAHQQHKVIWTDPLTETVWLAIFY